MPSYGSMPAANGQTVPITGETTSIMYGEKMSALEPSGVSLQNDHYLPTVTRGGDTYSSQSAQQVMILRDDEEEVSESADSSEGPVRETWSRGAEFVLSCVGYAVGLGNVWRFPYLCYKNGGGAFLIPYAICLVMGGIPVFFLEISLGQFMGRGGMGVWNIAPILKGVGAATIVILSMVNVYYIVILAWDGFYLADTLASIGSELGLPWAHCQNPWNTHRCVTTDSPCERGADVAYLSNATDSLLGNAFNKNSAIGTLQGSVNDSSVPQVIQVTLAELTGNETYENQTYVNCSDTVDSTVEYFNNRILQISGGVDEVGTIVWQLGVSLLIMWVLCYFCIWKGIRWTGKIVYFTATFPYLIITILVIRGVTLPGATSGLEYYLKPNFTKLTEAGVWLDAGTQIFYSYAVGLGVLTALGSYNTFNNNCYRHAVIIAGINTFTSLYAGVAIFSVLGFMAQEQGIDISKVTDGGPGLAFIAYPKAIATMPVAQPLWAALFFVMIIFVGLDSQFVGVEGFITIVLDIFPEYLRKPGRREVFTAAYCTFSFFCGLFMVTNGGMYVFQMFDYYSASGLALLWVCFFQCAAVAWVYGGRRFYDDIEVMIGYSINRWFLLCWTVLTPLICAGIFLFMCVEFKVLTYGKYEYPAGAQSIGLLMAFSSMICVPGYAVYALLTTPGTLKERFTILTTPVFTDRQLRCKASPAESYLLTDSTEKKVTYFD